MKWEQKLEGFEDPIGVNGAYQWWVWWWCNCNSTCKASSLSTKTVFCLARWCTMLPRAPALFHRPNSSSVVRTSFVRNSNIRDNQQHIYAEDVMYEVSKWDRSADCLVPLQLFLSSCSLSSWCVCTNSGASFLRSIQTRVLISFAAKAKLLVLGNVNSYDCWRVVLVRFSTLG